MNSTARDRHRSAADEIREMRGAARAVRLAHSQALTDDRRRRRRHRQPVMKLRLSIRMAMIWAAAIMLVRSIG